MGEQCANPDLRNKKLGHADLLSILKGSIQPIGDQNRMPSRVVAWG
jgi:hypothetical protein